jgi:flagellar hook-associated protein 3 FlgL
MMTFTSIGDLAQAFQTRRQNSALTRELNRLTEELSTGRRTDIKGGASGDRSPLAAIERELVTLESERFALTEAGQFATTLQAALGRTQDILTSLSNNIFTIVAPAQPAMASRVIAESRADFAAMVGALNTDIAGRRLLAGTATDGPALAAPDTILSALETLVNAAPTRADAIAAVDGWFAPGGGFDTVAYLGSATALAPVQIGGEDIPQNLRAADPEPRAALAAAALAALAGTGPLGASDTDRIDTLRLAAERGLAATDTLTQVRARVGTTESAVERAETRNASRVSALNLARAELTDIDPFATATRAREVQTQLEALYTLTARLSRLSLTEFLR